MSRILSIESSGNICAVSIASEKGLIAEYTVHEKNMHDKLLAKNAKQILDDLSLTISDIDAVAVSSGPGSYTGLRVGASLAKALCFDETPKLIDVPTMDAFAYDLNENFDYANQKAICLIHSHQDLFYYQEFDLNNNQQSEVSIKNALEIQKLKEANNIYMGVKTQKVKVDFEVGLDSLDVRRINDLAFKLFAEEKFVNPADFVPKYSQKFVVK